MRFLRHISSPSPQASADALALPTLSTVAELAAALAQNPWLKRHPCLIFWCSDFSALHPNQESSLRHALRHLSERHVLTLITVDDPADFTFPTTKNLHLADHSGHRLHLPALPARLPELYERYWRDRRTMLKQAASKTRTALIGLNTSEGPQAILRQLGQQSQGLRP
jgi:hypothetical protein